MSHKVPVILGDNVIINAPNSQYDRSIGKVVNISPRANGVVGYTVEFVRHVKFNFQHVSQITNVEDLDPQKYPGLAHKSYSKTRSVFDFALHQQLNRELSEES